MTTAAAMRTWTAAQTLKALSPEGATPPESWADLGAHIGGHWMADACRYLAEWIEARDWEPRKGRPMPPGVKALYGRLIGVVFEYLDADGCVIEGMAEARLRKASNGYMATGWTWPKTPRAPAAPGPPVRWPRWSGHGARGRGRLILSSSLRRSRPIPRRPVQRHRRRPIRKPDPGPAAVRRIAVDGGCCGQGGAAPWSCASRPATW